MDMDIETMHSLFGPTAAAVIQAQRKEIDALRTRNNHMLILLRDIGERCCDQDGIHERIAALLDQPAP